MTKSDLIDLLCEAEKMPKGRAELLINAIFDCMEASLRRGERIEIRGFGSFEIRNYRSYEGRNPRTGSAVSVKPKRLPFFKVGKELKERVNAAAGTAEVPRRAVASAAAAGDGGGAPAAHDGGKSVGQSTTASAPAQGITGNSGNSSGAGASKTMPTPTVARAANV
jgi:integration host factor subunit beta